MIRASTKVTDLIFAFNCYLQDNLKCELFLYLVWVENKLKMYGVIDHKHQISFENSYRLAVHFFNQLISKLNCARLPNCVPSLASRLPGKNNIAASNICPWLGRGVSA